MTNLMLTNYCNYKCPYCFGVDFMFPKVSRKEMSLETLEGLLDWMDKTPKNKSAVHLMGGEPTLHSQFEEVVFKILERGRQIVIFSNLASPKAPEYAEKLANFNISWVVNVNSPKLWNDVQNDRIRRALKTLGQKASITFNINPDGDDDMWAVDLIREYDLSRWIKVGFVLPTMTGSNYALEDEQYPVVAKKLINLLKNTQQYGIKAAFECGVPTCAFTDEQLGYLWSIGCTFDSNCDSRLDVSPEGLVIYCLPMSEIAKVHYTEFDNYFAAKKFFDDKLLPYRRLGRNENCFNCVLADSICRSGCVAKILLGAKNVK